MNPESFSTIGYVSVALWIGVVLLWLLHWLRPRRVLCRTALVFAVAAFVLAKINSKTHVEEIQLDRSAQMAAWEEQQKAREQAALDSRGEEVAQIRFAEDAAGEFLDSAGMDESDIKYMEKIRAGEVPAWKKEKRERSGAGAEDDGLEGLIDGEKAAGGLESEALDDAAESEPMLMVEADLAMANRLDAWNLRVIRWLIVIAVVIIVLDYLRRANIYREASFPMRLPSYWINSQTPLPAVQVRPKHPRRKMPSELAWLLKRGDCFVHLTDQPGDADTALKKLRKFAGRPGADVLRVGEGELDVDDDFIFEALWFGRSSFVIDSAERAESFLARFIELLEERRTTRARVRQSVHLVWYLNTPMPEEQRLTLEQLAKATGFSIFLADGS